MDTIQEILNLFWCPLLYALAFVVVWTIATAIYSNFMKRDTTAGFFTALAVAVIYYFNGWHSFWTKVKTSSNNPQPDDASVSWLSSIDWPTSLAILIGAWIVLGAMFKLRQGLSIVVALAVTVLYNLKPEIFNPITSNWLLAVLAIVALFLVMVAVRFLRSANTARQENDRVSFAMSMSQPIMGILVIAVIYSLFRDLFGDTTPSVWVAIKYVFLMITIVVVSKHDNVLGRPRDWAPKGSEESIHPLDERRAEDQEYLTRRSRAIERLKEENEPYRNFVHKPSILAWRLISFFAISALLIDVSLFVSFLVWVGCVVVTMAIWLRVKVKKIDKGKEMPFGRKNKLIIGLSPVVIVTVVWALQNVASALIGDESTWMVMSKMTAPWWEAFGLYLLVGLVIGAYLIGSYVKVPLQRRWVLSIEDKPIYGESVIIFTPDKDTVDNSMVGLYDESIREELKVELDRFGSNANDYFDNGPNWSWLSFVLYPWVDIKSSYYLLVEASASTEDLPTGAINEETQKRLGLDIKAGTAGELSYYHRFYTLIGVDPVVGVTRLGTSDTEEPIQLVGAIIEGLIADRVRGLEFDEAMMYPFVSGEDDPKEISALLSKLNVETLVMAGNVVVKFFIIDREPSQEIKDQINANTTARIAMDQAEFERGQALIEARAEGARLIWPLRMVAALIQGKDPEDESYNPSPEALAAAREYVIAQQATDPKSANRTLYNLPAGLAGILGRAGGESS